VDKMDTETKLFVVCGEHEATLKFRVEANVGGVTIEVEQCPDCKVSNHEEGYEEGSIISSGNGNVSIQNNELT